MTGASHLSAGEIGVAARQRALVEMIRLDDAEALVRFLEDLPAESVGACVALAAAWVEAMGAGMPDVAPWSLLRRDAADWADLATPPELEAYAAAALQRLRRQDFGRALRKRLLVELWASLGDDDRRAFLARVDPAGAFRS